MTKLSINDMILDLLKSTDLSNQEIANKIVAANPSAKTTAKSVASVASVARRFGVYVPKREHSNPSERIAELETKIADLERQLKVANYLNVRHQRKAA